MAGVLLRERPQGFEIQTHIEGLLKTEMEVGRMWPQAKGHGGPEAGGARKDPPLEPLREHDPATSWYLT